MCWSSRTRGACVLYPRQGGGSRGGGKAAAAAPLQSQLHLAALVTPSLPACRYEAVEEINPYLTPTQTIEVDVRGMP